MKRPALLLAVSAIILIVLVCGCTGQPAQTGSTDTSGNTGVSGETCTSPHDGTWKGTISDSGSLTVRRPPDWTSTHNPFTASYDFEMTIKCDLDTTSFNITHAKASHPIFDCANGCSPIGNVLIRTDGSGSMGIIFPNGASFTFPGYDQGLQVSPDGKTMALFFPGTSILQNIGLLNENDVSYSVETYNCQMYGGEGYCGVEYLNKNTNILTKVG